MDDDVKIGFGVSVVFLVIVVALWAAASFCEARSYERVTGKHVSTWDAMFLELRVQEPAK